MRPLLRFALLLFLTAYASAFAQGVVPPFVRNDGYPASDKQGPEETLAMAQRIPPRHFVPYPTSVLAREAPNANNDGACMSRFMHLGYLLVKGTAEDPLISVPRALSENGKARLRRLIVGATQSPHVLILESTEPSIWEVSLEDGANAFNFILRGSKEQAVAGPASTLKLSHSPLEPDKIGRGICGVRPVTGSERDDYRQFFGGRLPVAELVKYPYKGPPKGQAGDNSKERLLEALARATPEDFRALFKANFENKLASSGWRFMTAQDLAEWNAHLLWDKVHTGELLFPHEAGGAFLTAARPDAKYLTLPPELQPRVVYLGRSSKLTGDLQGATLLDVDTWKCRHSNVANPCADGQSTDNMLEANPAAKKAIDALWGAFEKEQRK